MSLVVPVAAFPDPLDLEYIDGDSYMLLKEFSYISLIPRLPVIHVPAGFITDFASIPRGLWNIFPPAGKHGKAAVIHDYLYRTPGLATRSEADRIFLDAMESLGVGRWTRYTMYYGVRVGGRRAYKGGL